MTASVELQVISKILTETNEDVVNQLCEFDPSYYSVFKEHITFILNHRDINGNVPDVFTFQAQFPDITLVQVSEPLQYLVNQLKRNKQQILLVETFNKLKDLGSGDVSDAWNYLTVQCDKAAQLDSTDPLDIIHDAHKRAEEVIKFSQQSRIPTGFNEIDKLMYGGLSTVEELLLIVARTNSGKTWICTKMMESAQKHGFPVLYYSPEMQASFLGTRFDTWRSHFQNSQLYQGKYNDEYMEYLDNLETESASAFILEDKDASDGIVNVHKIQSIVKRHSIKLVIVDGLSYMEDTRRSDTDYVKYRNICLDLFRMSKQFGCAVVIALQANRETKQSKDDKGDPMPTLYNIEGSDHPARIATQAFAVRQVFDKHVLDIRLEKSRIANNQKPILSYAWDVNTGNMQFIPGDDNDATSQVVVPNVQISSVLGETSAMSQQELEEDIDDDDIEF